MQPKIVNFKVNQYLYSLRLLLSSISFLSLSSLPPLSSSRARLICIHSHFYQFLCPFLPASQAFLLESFPFKSFLRFFFFFFFIKVCFCMKSLPPPQPLFLKNSCVGNTIEHWDIERHFFPSLKGFHYFIISCVAVEHFSWRLSFFSSVGNLSFPSHGV